MKHEHAIALRQAESDITRALQRLERETSRVVTAVVIHEGQTIGGPPVRSVGVELSPAPAENWASPYGGTMMPAVPGVKP